MSPDHPIQRILYPCESEAQNPSAFAHALRIATGARCYFGVLQALENDTHPRNWRGSPRVRGTLERWGALPAGSEDEDVEARLGLRAEKWLLEGRDPLSAIVDFHEKQPADLLVLSTAARTGLPRWLKPSIAETAARRLNVPALFVPATVSGFVDVGSGSIDLGRILIPVDHHPDPAPAIDAVIGLLDVLGVTSSNVTVLHVGSGENSVPLPAQAGERFDLVTTTRAGAPAATIIATAAETGSKLIAMATAGHHGFLDALRGGVSEQVLRSAPCPVLTVPSV